MTRRYVSSLNRKLASDHEFRRLSDPGQHMWFQVWMLTGPFGIEHVDAHEVVLGRRTSYTPKQITDILTSSKGAAGSAARGRAMAPQRPEIQSLGEAVERQDGHGDREIPG